jgi:crotonobetainyl-CoA:carnitine CoA-transferase CaiB-like acyl-CoA transferase
MAANGASAPGEWLGDLRVVDFSRDVAGPYCTKLLADAGADVIKVEPAEGDPMRRWSATGADLGGEDGALFRFLHHNKRAVVGGLEDDEVQQLVASADLVVESFAPGVIDPLDLPGRHPGLVLLSISPYGRGGPQDLRPATEFTIQAESGSIGTRGLPGQEPFQAGGRTVEWLAGPYAAVGALAAMLRAQATGHGEHVDFSLLEVTTIGGTNYTDLFWKIVDAGPPEGPLPQTVETPSIEPTKDGYVGFCTNSRQQFSDFLLMIDRTDLQDDEGLAQITGRMLRIQEWQEIVHAWTRTQTTQQVVEQASLLRIPVAPINNGETVQKHEHLAERGVFREDPTGTFVHPRPPYRISDQEAPPFRPAPKLGEHTGRIESREPVRPAPTGERSLPLDGVRVLDLTAWWAGPAACQMLAFLGAEVIHVESTKRPDQMRMVGGMFQSKFEAWWEASHFFLAANTNKRGLAIDLTRDRGQEVMRELLKRSDLVIENFTPRVMANFGLTWEALHALNPRLTMVRMPAFGLNGPWRDNTGFAQTMEQMTGLAWLTGHRDDQPRIQRGPCDPLAGMHAAFSCLVALAERERTGEGVHVECTMVEGALNAAAEQLIEFSAYGNLMGRDGNRCPESAPQGLYPCLGSEPGSERWLALSVHGDAQWEAFKGVLGHPVWADAPELATLAGRRTHHDRIDAELRPFFAEREREKLVDELLAAGVAASPLADPRAGSANPQMVARGFFEEFDHPMVGRLRCATTPFRYASADRWLHSAAPTLGQHNREILGSVVGLSDAELDALEAEGVIGTQLEGL